MEFLNAVPQPPYNPCKLSIEEKTQFFDQMARFDTIYQAKMDEYKEGGNDKYLEDHQDEATVNSLMKAGYSREDAEKMKDLDNMSEEEKLAMANKMMMSKYNMDLDEAKKVAKSDTAAQRRWVKAQSTMMMADAQADLEKNTTKQVEIKNDLELQQEIKMLNDKLRAGENKYQEKIREIDVKADSAMSVLRPELEKLQMDLQEGNGNSNQIIDKIISLRQQYCERFTPSYLETVEGFKGYITEHLKEYSNLEEMQMKSMERQTGMKNPDYKPGAGTMGIVGTYKNLVSNAFKYNLNADWGAQFIGY
jgi:hypothetical protein